MTTGLQIAFDTADPHAQAAFWAAALGYEVEDHTAIVDQLVAAGRLPEAETLTRDGRRCFADVATCRDSSGGRPRLFFQRVPEPKSAKNRVHLDLHVGPENVDAEVERLLDLGATKGWETADRGPRTITLYDPEGNEFCVS
ncbi:VOC family protein [Cryptosporangium minutisporangium]|uniref:VOC family protein n=1 Tax=Cryptosporangium minutisporangium TaxID=113569 RepID=A0ABP6SVD5_9ACTN